MCNLKKTQIPVNLFKKEYIIVHAFIAMARAFVKFLQVKIGPYHFFLFALVYII